MKTRHETKNTLHAPLPLRRSTSPFERALVRHRRSIMTRVQRSLSLDQTMYVLFVTIPSASDGQEYSTALISSMDYDFMFGLQLAVQYQGLVHARKSTTGNASTWYVGIGECEKDDFYDLRIDRDGGFHEKFNEVDKDDLTNSVADLCASYLNDVHIAPTNSNRYLCPCCDFAPVSANPGHVVDPWSPEELQELELAIATSG